ncbi:MAG: ATP-dependent DNA helicase [Patescibacteria group bacterium]
MKDATFQKQYKKLNPAQRLAVDSIEGPVMVVAGPGTGKTQVLTLRIANILKLTDASPDSILALTFTESATYNLRTRLVQIVGAAGYRVGIFTFHSFCNDVIRRYSPHFPRIVGYSHANIIDQILILEEIIKRSKLNKLKPFGNPYFYVRDIISTIGKLKRENIDPDKLEKLVKREPKERSERNKEFIFLYREYQKSLRQKGYYDYDDMIMEVIAVLKKDKELLLRLQEEFQYVLADEHQDANAGQNELLELLMSFHKNPNIFVVGDEKQAIFRFQGASLENFKGFKKAFPGAQVIALTHNYRSRTLLIDAANKLLPGKLVSGRTQTPGNPRLPGVGNQLPGVRITSFATLEQELEFILHDIERHVKEGISAGEIAVLYRDNRDALPLVRILEKGDVPFMIESDQDILEDNDIRKLINLLQAIESVSSKEKLSDALHIDFLNVESSEIYKFLREGISTPRIRYLTARVSAWHKMSKNKSLIECFEIIVRESGFLSHILGLPDAVEKMGKLNSLFDELKILLGNHPKYSLTDFLKYIDLLTDHNVLVKGSASPAKSGGRSVVHLMTAHKAKGQEFDIVYIVGAIDGHWGGRRIANRLAFEFLGADSDTEDERRLFYVALTRAKDELVITYANSRSDGKSALPSRFLTELDISLSKSPKATSPEGYALRAPPGKQFAPRVQTGVSISDKTYLNNLFTEQGLSVSALGNYLECPWKYFYVNLLRVPTALESYHMYGIAIHAALKDLFARDLDRKGLLSNFTRHISEQPLGKIEIARALKRGQKVLGGYYDTYYKTWNKNVLTELAIKGVLLGETKLTGRLDKLELIDPHGNVSVIDYKTGKPKSRNEIVKSGYLRQLTFYKILLDRFANGRYKMTSGEIDFVEPNERGYYKKEKFEIESDAVEELEKEIARISSEIKSLKFWREHCEDPKCPWCALHKMMK